MTTNAVHELYPYLRVKDCARAIDYYIAAFGAVEKFRLVEPGGRIGHCELLLGKLEFMVSEEYPELDALGPQSRGGTSVGLHLHVDNCDELLARAVAAGGTITRPATDHFYGERSGVVRDPFGHEWMIGHSIEDVSPDEMQRRYDRVMAST